MPPTHVKANVKRGKNDAADAAAIWEGRNAAIDAFCADQECERQCALMLHRRGNLLIRQRTQLINAIRGNDDRSKSIQDRTRVRRPRYLRRLLVINAISIVGTARMRPDKYPG